MTPGIGMKGVHRRGMQASMKVLSSLFCRQPHQVRSESVPIKESQKLGDIFLTTTTEAFRNVRFRFFSKQMLWGLEASEHVGTFTCPRPFCHVSRGKFCSLGERPGGQPGPERVCSPASSSVRAIRPTGSTSGLGWKQALAAPQRGRRDSHF